MVFRQQRRVQENIPPTQPQISIWGEARTCQDGVTIKTMVVEIITGAHSSLGKNQNWIPEKESHIVRKVMKMSIKEIQRFERYQGQKWIPSEPQSGVGWLLCKRSGFLPSTRAVSVMTLGKKSSCLPLSYAQIPWAPKSSPV